MFRHLKLQISNSCDRKSNGEKIFLCANKDKNGDITAATFVFGLALVATALTGVMGYLQVNDGQI